MIALIEADCGKINLDVSFAGYMGAGQIAWYNKGCDIKFASKEGLPIALCREEFRDDLIIPFGSVEFIKKFCEIRMLHLPKPLNVPESLSGKLGRKIWTCKKSELKQFPVFCKPLDELKLFTGFVAKSERDFELYPELNGWDGMLFCSEPLGKIFSEWRCYVLQGEVFNCSCYAGDSLVFPDKNEIQYLVSAYKDAPAGYSLDVAVTNSGTKLVECNDAWALGYYGGDYTDYFGMVKARWLQIIDLRK